VVALCASSFTISLLAKLRSFIPPLPPPPGAPGREETELERGPRVVDCLGLLTLEVGISGSREVELWVLPQSPELVRGVRAPGAPGLSPPVVLVPVRWSMIDLMNLCSFFTCLAAKARLAVARSFLFMARCVCCVCRKFTRVLTPVQR
jgi:hypothetical protein